MRHVRRSPEQVPLILFDLIAAIGFYVAASFYVLTVSASTYLLYEGGLNASVLAASSLVILLYSRGMYARRAHRLDLMQDLCISIGGTLILQAVVFYVGPGFALPPSILMIGTVAFAALFILRWTYQRLRNPKPRFERLLFVAATPLNRSIAAHIARRPELGYVVTGYLDDKLPAGTELEGARVLGGLNLLGDVRHGLDSDRIIADVSADAAILMTSCGAISDRLEEPDELYESLFGRVCGARLKPSTLLFRGGWTGPRGMIALQAIYTNLAALAVFILLTPLMIAIAILIKVTSRGPVCETELVMGWHMAQFRLFRFRCHRTFTAPDGERREETPIGRWLKRLHLDRLPYLINILRGELAFVGPAPARVEAAADLMATLPYYRLRYAVKPGITGWSQVKSGPEDDTLDKLGNDLYYIKHISPAFDLSIILNSLFRVREPQPAPVR